jgi:hypothetical protein
MDFGGMAPASEGNLTRNSQADGAPKPCKPAGESSRASLSECHLSDAGAMPPKIPRQSSVRSRHSGDLLTESSRREKNPEVRHPRRCLRSRRRVRRISGQAEWGYGRIKLVPMEQMR